MASELLSAYGQFSFFAGLAIGLLVGGGLMSLLPLMWSSDDD